LANNTDAERVSDSGFGLIEIVISMFLLGLLAVVFLPLLVTSLQTSVRNSTIATATQSLEQQMGLARSAGDTCAALTAYGAVTPLPTTSDIRGTVYQPDRTVDSCPSALASYPTTVKVRVSVLISGTIYAAGSSYSPVTATTLIYLKGP